MEPVLRAAAVYFFVLVIFRFAGKRTLAQITTFDFVLLLIVSEATQNALIHDDNSITNAFVVVLTLVMIDVGLTLLKGKFPVFDRIIEGVPVLLMKDGQLLRDRMHKVKIDDEDILEEARRNQGLDSLDQIRHAVLERNGAISIVPKN